VPRPPQCSPVVYLTLTLILVLPLITVPRAAYGWGREGHRLTALVAEQYLTPQTRAEVTRLLGNQSMADVAPWADDYRSSHPETAPWHFVDIPSTASHFDRDRDCPVPAKDPASFWHDCITDRILEFEQVLGNTALTDAERAQALRFLIHFIGDIHQPFHALGDERGGNGISVSVLGSVYCGTHHCNLHGVWDDELIEQHGLKEQKFAAMLIDKIQQNHWERFDGGDPVAWAEASHRYAVQALAPNNAILPRDYIETEEKIVDAQLAMGGLRLAHVLNQILGGATNPAGAAPAVPTAH